MRGVWGTAIALLLLVATVACKTSQPLEVGERTIAVTLKSTNTVVNLFDVYDVFRDGFCEEDPGPVPCMFAADCFGIPGSRNECLPNGFCNRRVECGSDAACAMAGFTGMCLIDGLPDDTDGDGVPNVQPFCVALGTTTTASSVPWNYTIEISVIREGQTVPEPLTSGQAAVEFDNNMTPYDESVFAGAPNRAPLFPNIIFVNPRRVTAAHRDVLEGAFPCLGGSLGDARIDNSDPPLSAVVNKGDTLVVKARKADFGPGVPVMSEPTLSGELTLDGQAVIGNGTLVSEAQPGAGISFWFTIQ